jgi:hypothetical protein
LISHWFAQLLQVSVETVYSRLDRSKPLKEDGRRSPAASRAIKQHPIAPMTS